MPASPKPSRTPMPATFDKSRVLLVEGETPYHFFLALTRHLLIADSLDILNYKGITELRPYLMTAASTESFRGKVRSLGIVRDAEGNAAGARDAVDAAVKAARLPDGMRVSVRILPGGADQGNIETLCLRSVEDHAAYPCLQAFVDCTAANGVVWPEGYSRDKALVQVFGATLPEPQPYAGLAAHKKAWPWGSPAFAELVKFLKDL